MCVERPLGYTKKKNLSHPFVRADLEELCGDDGSNPSVYSPGTHDALLQRAQAAEERAHRSEEALARAMEDLHKLKSVTVHYFHFILFLLNLEKKRKDSIFMF